VDEAVKEVASSCTPDLIILGLPLPNDTLAQFVSNLKRLVPNTHIFLLIRKCNSAVEKQALSVGITAVFSKFDDYEGLILNAEALFNPKLVTEAKAKTNSFE
jgi:DNA-binding NarL/FixJ family response regulator